MSSRPDTGSGGLSWTGAAGDCGRGLPDGPAAVDCLRGGRWEGVFVARGGAAGWVRIVVKREFLSEGSLNAGTPEKAPDGAAENAYVRDSGNPGTAWHAGSGTAGLDLGRSWEDGAVNPANGNQPDRLVRTVSRRSYCTLTCRRNGHRLLRPYSRTPPGGQIIPAAFPARGRDQLGSGALWYSAAGLARVSTCPTRVISTFLTDSRSRASQSTTGAPGSRSSATRTSSVS